MAQAAHQRQIKTICGQHKPRVDMRSTCFSIHLFQGKGPSAGREEKYTLRGNRTILSLTLRDSAPAIQNQTLPSSPPPGEWWPLGRGGFASHQTPVLAVPFTLNRGYSCQNTVWKGVTGISTQFSSPTKDTGYMQSVQRNSHLRSPFQDLGSSTVLPKFIEAKSVKQN